MTRAYNMPYRLGSYRPLTRLQERRWDELRREFKSRGHIPSIADCARLWGVSWNLASNTLSALAMRGLIQYTPGAPIRMALDPSRI